MADPVRSLHLGTIVWFGSLEFMSLGHEYDMVLLSPRAPSTDDDVLHRQPTRGRRPCRRSRQARRAPRGRVHPNTTQVQNADLCSTGIPYPAAGTKSLHGDLSGLSLDRGKGPVAHSDAPSSSSVPPPPKEPALAEQSLATAPSPYPFGLTNVAASYATALVSIHQRHAHDPIVTTPIHP